MFYFNQSSLFGVSGSTAGCTHAFGYWSMITLLSTKLSYVMLVI